MTMPVCERERQKRFLVKVLIGRLDLSLELYLLRYGETIYSETGAYCGDVDAELTTVMLDG